MCLSLPFTVRLAYFVWFGATSCLLPFLSLHMRTLGIPALESGIISGLIALLQIVTCPLAFFTAKRTNSYKKTTLWFLSLTAVTVILLVFAPRVPQQSKKSISMHFQCGPSVQPGLIVDKCNRNCENNALLKDGIDAYFTECHVDCPDRKGNFKNTADLCFDDNHSRVCHVVEVNNTLSENFTFGIYLGQAEHHKENECLYPMEGVTWHQSFYHHVSCPIILRDANSQCALRCDLQEVTKDGTFFTLSGQQNCMSEGPDAITSAIWIYFCLRVVFHFVLGLSTVLTERALLCTLKKERRDYSKYIVWSFISAGFVTPLAGFLIDYGDKNDIIFNYNSLCLAFMFLTLVTTVTLASLNVDDTLVPSVKEIARVIPKLLKEMEVDAAFTVIFLLGAISGFLDTFLFWHLENLHCPHCVMGATITAGLVIAIPFLSKKCSTFVMKMQPGNILSLCFLLQCVRCLSYNFIQDFRWCILIELSGTAAFHLLWAGVSAYTKELTQKKYHSAFQSCTGPIHFGLGRSCGAVIGGIGIANFGFRFTFLGFGSVSAVSALLYFPLYKFVLRKLPKNLMQTKADLIMPATEQLEEKAVSLLTPPLSLVRASLEDMHEDNERKPNINAMP